MVLGLYRVGYLVKRAYVAYLASKYVRRSCGTSLYFASDLDSSRSCSLVYNFFHLLLGQLLLSLIGSSFLETITELDTCLFIGVSREAEPS